MATINVGLPASEEKPNKYSKSGLATIFLLLIGTTVFLPIWGEDGMLLFFVMPIFFLALVLATFFFVIFLVKSKNKTPYLLFIIPLIALYIYTFVNVMYLDEGIEITGHLAEEVFDLPSETPETSGDVIGSIILSDLPPDDCNEPMGVMRSADAGHAVVMMDGNVSFWGDAYVAAEVDGALSGLQVQWFTGETEVNPQSQDDFATPAPMDRYVKKWNLHSKEENVKISKACDGKSYVHLVTPSLESGFGVEGTWLAPRKIVVLLDGTVVGEQAFYFQQ